MTGADVETCAAIACDSDIGRRYGFSPERMAAQLAAALASGRQDLFVACDFAEAPMAAIAEAPMAAAADAPCGILGFAWVDPRGAFSSAPYLRLIAVAPGGRGAGVGSALLAAFEERTAEVGRDWCLLVSDFNARAIAFYERHGYAKVGALSDFAVPGIAEIIMAKRRNAHAPV